MNLDEVKKEKVAAWIQQGLKLSEIQNRLASELGVNLTYMEVRLLVNDLQLMPKDQPRPQAPGQIAAQSPLAETASPPEEVPEDSFPEELAEEGEAPSGVAGKVSLSVDKLARPGALVSGSVTFSDGNSAAWYLDQLGRLGIVPKREGYRPPPQELQSFQVELQKQLQKLGF